MSETGRPSVWEDPAVEQKLEQYLRLGATVKHACAVARIATRTFYDRCERDETFSHRVDEWRDDVTTLALTKQKELMDNGSQPMIANYLNKRHPEYREKIESKIEQTTTISFEDAMKLTPEEITKRLNGIK